MLAPGGATSTASLQLAETLWTETEGSPLFLREILRHLIETGAVAREPDGTVVVCGRIERLGVPEGVREVIGRRLTRLSDQANAVLRSGAVMGRELRLDVLEHVTGIGLDELLDAVDEAAAAGLLTEVSGSVGHYAFTHALVRGALYEELSLTRRVRQHQRVGEALESIHREDVGLHLPELAYHFSQAAVGGTAAKALVYATRAAEQAFAGVAYEEATRLYHLALEVADEAGTGSEDRIDLMMAMGRAQWRAGAGREAEATYEDASALARQLGDTERLGWAALGYVAAGARPFWTNLGAVNTRGLELLEEALISLSGDSAVHAMVLAYTAAELYLVPGSDERRRDLANHAVDMARRIGDLGTLGYVLQARLLATFSPDTLEQRRADAKEFLEVGLRLDEPWRVGGGHCFLTMAAFEAGDIEDAYRRLDDLERLVEEMKEPATRQWMISIRACIAVLEGRFSEGEALAAEGMRLGQDVHDPNALLTTAQSLAAARVHQGRAHEAIGALPEIRDVFPAVEGLLRLGAYGALAEAGLADEALGMLDGFDPADTRAFPRHFYWNSGLLMASVGCFRLEDRALAEVIYRLQLPFEDRVAEVGGSCWGPVSFALALNALVLERWDDAERHIAVTLAFAERARWPVITAHGLRLRAHLLARRAVESDRAAALDVAAAALRLATELGMAGLVNELESLQAELRGEQPPSRKTTRVTRRDRARARFTNRGRRLIEHVTADWSDEKLASRFRSHTAQRGMFSAMATAFQPAMAGGFSGALGFELQASADDLDPARSDWWSIDVHGTKAKARPGRPEEPVMTLHIGLPDFVRLASGEVGPVRLLVEGKARIEGDILLGARLGEMFGLVQPFEVPLLNTELRGAEAPRETGKS
jgi:hypothetical protein